MPSRVRSFRIYSGQNSLSPTRAPNPLLYKWSPKHPLETGSWWADASGWCQDIGDTLLAPPASVMSPADDSLMVVASTISTDGLWAGFLLAGGIAGTEYTITLRLIGKTTGVSWAGGVRLQCTAPAPALPAPAGLATMNRSLLTIGGKTLVPGTAA
jgi:hypothetical protein